MSKLIKNQKKKQIYKFQAPNSAYIFWIRKVKIIKYEIYFEKTCLMIKEVKLRTLEKKLYETSFA